MADVGRQLGWGWGTGMKGLPDVEREGGVRIKACQMSAVQRWGTCLP